MREETGERMDGARRGRGTSWVVLATLLFTLGIEALQYVRTGGPPEVVSHLLLRLREAIAPPPEPPGTVPGPPGSAEATSPGDADGETSSLAFAAYDSLLGWSLLPGRWDWDGLRVTIGSKGIRGSLDHRVAMIGDSFVFGQVHDEETIPAQLGAVNLGAPAYGPDQMWLRWRRASPDLDVDLTVVGIIRNALERVHVSRFGGAYKPWFERGPDGELLLHRPGPGATPGPRDPELAYDVLFSFLDEIEGDKLLVYLPMRGDVLEGNSAAPELRRRAEERGVPFLDVTPLFQVRGAASEELWGRNKHYDAHGNALVAEAIRTREVPEAPGWVERLPPIRAAWKSGELGPLVAALEDGQDLVRLAATNGIWRVGPGARAAIPRLREIASSDPSPQVRKSAARALRRLGAPPTEAAQRTRSRSSPSSKRPSTYPSTPSGPFSSAHHDLTHAGPPQGACATALDGGGPIRPEAVRGASNRGEPTR